MVWNTLVFSEFGDTRDGNPDSGQGVLHAGCAIETASVRRACSGIRGGILLVCDRNNDLLLAAPAISGGTAFRVATGFADPIAVTAAPDGTIYVVVVEIDAAVDLSLAEVEALRPQRLESRALETLEQPAAALSPSGASRGH